MSAPTKARRSSSTPDPRYRVVAYNPRDGFETGIPVKRVSDILAQYDTLLWLDIQDPTENDVRILEEEMGIHALALEDVLGNHPRPKCVEYPGFYVLVMNAVGL